MSEQRHAWWCASKGDNKIQLLNRLNFDSNPSSSANLLDESVMSCFDRVPNELITIIVGYLMDDTTSFVNFSSTCKRIHQICDQSTGSPSWIENRPTPFNFYLDLTEYKPSDCSSHDLCDEHQRKVKAGCEILSQNSAALSVSNELYSRPNHCYYHRLYCLTNARYRKFSSLRFIDSRLEDRTCLKWFREAKKPKWQLHRPWAQNNVSAIVELELYDCEITMDWLNTILNELVSIKYLALDNVSITDPNILVEPKHLASRCLNLLRISGDRTFRFNDAIFKHFLDHFPAAEFDISATRVEFHKRIIQRFYPVFTEQRPSEYILTFPMMLSYLKKYQAVVKHFVANETNITSSSLRKILRDEELKHLKITVKDCPLITLVERTRLFEQVDEDDISRVTFY